jgi:hypothetical protein
VAVDAGYESGTGVVVESVEEYDEDAERTIAERVYWAERYRRDGDDERTNAER